MRVLQLYDSASLADLVGQLHREGGGGLGLLKLQLQVLKKTRVLNNISESVGFFWHRFRVVKPKPHHDPAFKIHKSGVQQLDAITRKSGDTSFHSMTCNDLMCLLCWDSSFNDRLFHYSCACPNHLDAHRQELFCTGGVSHTAPVRKEAVPVPP